MATERSYIIPSPNTVTVLLIEDDPQYAFLIQAYLKNARGRLFEITCASTLKDGTRRLLDRPVDLILMDMALPDSSGLETFRKLRAAAGDVPIIVLSGHDDEPLIVESLREGAQDFLIKDDTTPDLLVRAIMYAIERQRNLIALKELETQFRQSQKMEAVGRLAGGVAHDFNNLLTAIIGYCKFLEGSMAPADSRLDDLRQISGAANRATSLTKQLLAFSRRQVLTLKVINLNAVVESMGKMLERLISEDIKLRVVLDAKLRNVKADIGQIEQVIMNLVVNARDAMPRGGEVTVETGNVDFDEASPSRHDSIPPGSYAMIAVSDSGGGMSANTLSHIFEPFFTTKAQGKGTGLGLSTVYGIVKQIGGHVWVYSEVDRGSVFKIYLPVTSESIVKAEDERPPITTVRGTETILLAEDDESVRRIVMRTLTSHGYRVLEARNGKEAMKLLDQKHKIDLVLTDIVMPELGGRGLADYVIATRPCTKIIFMSGYTDDVVTRQGEIEPGMMFIQKPIIQDSLLRQIRYALDELYTLSPAVLSRVHAPTLPGDRKRSS